MKDILIVDTPFVGYPSNNRSNYIPEMLIKEGYDVEKVSSNFNHFTKKLAVEDDYHNSKFKITLIPTIPYKKNLSLSRYLSQKKFAKNLEKYLNEREKPDLIYNFIPSLDVGQVVAKYAKKNDIKYVIDVRDLWPEAFKMVIKNQMISTVLFYPMTRKANRVYNAADGIIAVSDTYKERALSSRKISTISNTVYLGTNLDHFNFKTRMNNILTKQTDQINLVYTGTLGHSYNLPLIFEAMKILKEEEVYDIKLTVIGNGPLESHFKNEAEKYELNVNFTGRISYEEVVSYLQSSDIAVNPIVPKAAQSIINKHADYAAAGLPVLNTQNSKEYRDLIELNQIGMNTSSNPHDVARKLKFLIENKELRHQMSINHRNLAEEIFDRKKTYIAIVDMIQKLLMK